MIFSPPVALASLYGSGLYGAGAYGGTTAVAPSEALNPSPADGATSVSTSTGVSWTAGSGATSHAVYFGTDATPDASEFIGTQSGTTYDPGTLSASTTYYWRIDEVNVSGTTTGTVWSFSTVDAGAEPAPTAASAPSPADLQTSVSTSSSLGWTAGSGATTRGVYFGTAASLDAGDYQGNQGGTTYDPGPLSANTTYWWRIDEANAQGTTTGPLWSFTTVAAQAPGSAPNPATNPAPTSGAVGVATSQPLSWTAGSGATSHAVYFGTDSTPDETEFKGSQAGTTFNPGTLGKNTTYWWRIDEVNVSGTTTGTVWSFTTTVPSQRGVCRNCGRTSQEGESASPETTTLPESPAPTTDESGAATSTRGGSPVTTPFRCAKTAPETDGLSPAGLVNLLVSLGIIPVEKAKPACDALSAKTVPTQSAAGVVPFSQTLRLGARGAEVTRLQVFLNTRGFAVAESGPGSRGSETELFGTLTEGAVKRYQAAYAAEILVPVGLTTPSGFWGPSSIKKANALVGA
jgi:hypothetical protein